MFLCRKSRGIFFTRLKNAQREACFTVLSGKSQIINEILCFTEFTKMKHFGSTKDENLDVLQLMIKGRVILFAPLHSQIFFPAVLLCCVFASPPIDLLITFLISYVKNTLTFFVKLDTILLTLAVRLQMSSGTCIPIYIDR